MLFLASKPWDLNVVVGTVFVCLVIAGCIAGAVIAIIKIKKEEKAKLAHKAKLKEEKLNKKRK